MTIYWPDIDETLTALSFFMIGLYTVVVHDVAWSHFANMIYVAVVFSILVQATTIGRLFPREFLARLMGSTHESNSKGTDIYL